MLKKIYLEQGNTVRAGFASLTDTAWDYLTELLGYRHVIDYGAGSNLDVARAVIERAERKPFLWRAVDVEPITATVPIRPGNNVLTFRYDFAKLPSAPCDVALVSWPVNNERAMNALIPHLQRAESIAVIGCHTDGSVVGTPAFWNYLLKRKLRRVYRCRSGLQFLAHYEHETPRIATRFRYQEERAGVTDKLERWSPDTIKTNSRRISKRAGANCATLDA